MLGQDDDEYQKYQAALAEIDRLNAIIADQTRQIVAISTINWPEIVRKLEKEVQMLRARLAK